MYLRARLPKHLPGIESTPERILDKLKTVIQEKMILFEDCRYKNLDSSLKESLNNKIDISEANGVILPDLFQIFYDA